MYFIDSRSTTKLQLSWDIFNTALKYFYLWLLSHETVKMNTNTKCQCLIRCLNPLLIPLFKFILKWNVIVTQLLYFLISQSFNGFFNLAHLQNRTIVNLFFFCFKTLLIVLILFQAMFYNMIRFGSNCYYRRKKYYGSKR